MKLNFDTVIFDLDGTLLNTLEDLADSVNYALREAGMPRRTIEEIRSFVGNGVLRLMELSVPGGKEHPQFQRAFDCFKAHYSVHCNDKTKPYEGIFPLLENLKERGIKMGIVSNKYCDAVTELSNRYFKEYMLAAIGESEQIHKKPAPDTVLYAMKLMESRKENTVLVGDSEVDLMTAANAGINFIAVTWGFRSREELERAGGTGNSLCFADSPESLFDLF